MWTDVTAFAPDLSSVDASAQADVLAYVNAELDVSAFDGEAGAKTRLARIYLAAHHGAVSLTSSAAAGPVVEEKVGEISQKYGSPAATVTGSILFLESTPYGRLYLGLVRTTIARLPVSL